MNVVYFYADSPQEWNCSQWNCINPTNAINRTENHKAIALHIDEFVTNTENAQKACSEADIIVLERNYFGDCLTMLHFWKVRGKTIIAIFDDAYNLIHPKNVSYNFWTKGELTATTEDGKQVQVYMNPKPLEQFKWALRAVKAVQVPSVNLAKDWSEYNKNTYYVRNYLDIEKYKNVEPLYPHEGIVIGWCGSMSHYASFADSGIPTALKKIGKKYPQVKFLFGGDKRIFDMVEVEQKLFQPYVPAEQWTPLLKTIDIGLAPLAGEYDKRRSWIKVLEYMALKVPWVATNYETYSELADYGVLTENGSKNWEAALSEVIENYPVHKERAEKQGYDFALSQSIDENIEKVTLKLYEDIIKSPYP